MLHAMIMAGGGGTRFWPRSRAKRPKQFLTMSGERTLLQSTVDRVAAQIPAENTWIITGAAHAGEAAKQLPELPAGRIVGEPVGRDTTAAVGLGAAIIAKYDPDATILVMPSDHVIEPVQEFGRAAHAAEQLVRDHPAALITFGIPPTFPATGYGYIHRGASAGERQRVPAFQVQKFYEKPSADRAEQYLNTGEYYWNAGIFCWRADTILNEIAHNEPAIHAACQRIAAAWGTPEQDAVFAHEYDALKKISIDFAVMEKAKEVLVLHAPYKWDDVGSWLALERMNPQDAHGNTVQAKHVGIDTANCVIVADDGHLIATIGVKDLLIIQDGDATLIADRTDEGTVKQIVDRLKSPGLERYL